MRTFRDPILTIILLVSVVFGTLTLTRGHDWGDDFASYVGQAKSIWNGTTNEFVEHNRFTIFESSILLGPVAYPWGYPLILVPSYAFKGLSPLVLKLPGLASYLGFLICLFILTKDRFTRTESLLLVSLFAFNPLLLDFLNQITSDIPFLFLSTFVLLLMTIKKMRKPFDLVILGTLISFAFFVRTQGILLLSTFLLAEIIQLWKDRTDRELTKKRAWNMLIVSGSFTLWWAIYAMIFPGGGESYLVQYRDFRLETVSGFVRLYFWVFSLFFGQTTAWEYLYYFVFVFFLIGVWVRQKEDDIFIFYSLLWMLLIITWPSWQGPRFIFPLLPIFMIFAFQGMKTVAQRLAGKWQMVGQKVIMAFWVIITGVFLFTSTANAYNNISTDRVTNGPYDLQSTTMFDYIREKTPPDSIIVFFKPRAMRLFTNRDSFMSFECERLPLGDYIVLSKKAENSQIPVEQIGFCNLPLDDVYENRRFLVLKILK
ncbi:MAG: glycosyltransferase family 39 protein [Chloroflexi bacterium]|nr:glycosyltransferase family 39 protein [Chloroflexota bacterium]